MAFLVVEAKVSTTVVPTVLEVEVWGQTALGVHFGVWAYKVLVFSLHSVSKF